MEYPYLKKVYSEIETAQLAVEFAKGLRAGDVIILNGNLGAGKTFFIKKAAAAFGIENVSSPTFALVNEYRGRIRIYHFDFYRINEIEELYDIGLNDYLADEESILFIEWGNLFPNVLPQKRIEINISINGDFIRTFNITEHV